jgi:hypothetical protein
MMQCSLGTTPGRRYRLDVVKFFGCNGQLTTIGFHRKLATVGFFIAITISNLSGFGWRDYK